MNRKARTRRSKIPMSVRNGEGGRILLAGSDPSDRRTQPPPPAEVPAEVSRAESSPPSPVGPRPQAPALTFPTTPPRPSDDAEARAADTAPTLQMDHETPPDPIHPDDVSVPPVGIDGDFFGSDSAFSAESFEIDPRDPRVLKLTPLMAQRRARFAKYVTVAVGFAAILCAAAAVKITIARGNESSSRGASNRGSVVSPVAAQEPVAAPVEKAAVAEETALRPDPGAAVVAPNEAPPPGQVAAAPAAPEQAQAAALPAQTEAPAVAVAAAPPSAEAPAATLPADVADLDPKALAKEAGKAKAKARGALEWGKMGDAIAAGERSVAIDPTDSEAWLILGVAYQQKGDSKNAVRSFKACLDQGKRGPRNECALMMH